MMSLADLDTYYVKSVESLHLGETSVPSYLQLNLEEAIRSKTGLVKDYSSLIASLNNRPLEEIPTTTHGIEESKTTSSSDNELELDLFNDDLMCIICNGMNVAARNRLLECSDCHALYHQECHRPPVTSFDSEDTWTCHNCKEASKTLKKPAANSPPTPATAPSPIPTTKSVLSNTLPSNCKVSTSKPPNGSVSKLSSSTSKLPGKTSSTVSSSVKTSVTPNMISADKRLQIMKKKAAKLHEKRKQLPRQ